MDKLGFDLDDGSSASPGNQKQSNPQEARILSIQRCIQGLVHACQCRDADCRLPSCLKMKRVVAHAKLCKRKTNGGCPICKQLIALCCYHAKHCVETKCPVPFCANIKSKLRQQQAHQRVQQNQRLRRQMQMMGGGASGAASASPAPPRPPPGTPQTASQTLPSSQIAGLSGKPVSDAVLAALQEPAMSLTPPTRTRVITRSQNQVIPTPRRSLRRPKAARQVQEDVDRQRPHAQGIAHVNVPVGPLTQNNRQPPTHQHPMNMMPTPGNPNNSMPPGGNPMMLQQQQLQSSRTQPQGQQPNQPQAADLIGGAQPGQIATRLGTGQVLLHQLLQILRSPATPEQQAQVLQILKSNPQLMTAFIKHRQQLQLEAQQQEQQQQQLQAQQQEQQQQQLEAQQQEQQQQQLEAQQQEQQQQQLEAQQQEQQQQQLQAQQQEQQQLQVQQEQQQQPGQGGQPMMQLVMNQPQQQHIVIQHPNGSGTGQVLLHQLLQTLRTPATPELQAQVLQILKSNPQLMTAFIRYRQQQQRRAQQQQQQQPVPGG